MADQIQKFLARLSRSEFELVEALLLDIVNGELSHLDNKPLKGHKNVYRVRKGKVRVVYSRIGSEIKILQISRRDNQTYSNF